MLARLVARTAAGGSGPHWEHQVLGAVPVTAGGPGWTGLQPGRPSGDAWRRPTVTDGPLSRAGQPRPAGDHSGHGQLTLLF